MFVDTAPVMEKPLAARAGPRLAGQAHQSRVARIRLLAVPRRDLHRPRTCARRAGEPTIADNCRACLDACPTSAFPAPYRLDARRCISYLTIEHKGPIPRELRPAIGNRIYGCDDCLAVCPWNKFASTGREAKLAARDDLAAPPLAELAALDEAGFRALFAGGPIKRVGQARFLRNVMIAIGNSGEPRARRRARSSGSTTRLRWSGERRSGRLRGLPRRDSSPPSPRRACERSAIRGHSRSGATPSGRAA